MHRSIAMAGVVFALIASPAVAGVIGPTKPSQQLVLRVSGSGSVCLPQGGGQDVDLQVFPDGHIDTYAPPPGQAFVITGIDWGTSGGTANEYQPIAIRLTSPHPPSALVFVTGALADAAGKTWASAVVPNVTVPPGETICVGAAGLTQVAIHGYLTTYK